MEAENRKRARLENKKEIENGKQRKMCWVKKGKRQEPVKQIQRGEK